MVHIAAFNCANIKYVAVDCLCTNLPGDSDEDFRLLKAFACCSQPPDEPLHITCEQEQNN